ncbi:hypothetical protein, partial [Blautia wexlerae]|uniref:hypothetical protein n=1 Tax=Blautia wexlerae TaxID=418240 RepID=UPI001D019F58
SPEILKYQCSGLKLTTLGYCPIQHSQKAWENHSLDFDTPAQQSTGFHIAPTDRVQAPPTPPKGSDTGAVSVIPILINST